MRTADLHSDESAAILKSAVWKLALLLAIRFFYDLFAIEIAIQVNLWLIVFEAIFGALILHSIIVPLFALGRRREFRRQLLFGFLVLAWCATLWVYPTRAELFLMRNEDELLAQVADLLASGEELRDNTKLGACVKIRSEPLGVRWTHLDWGLGDTGILWLSDQPSSDEESRLASSYRLVSHVRGPWYKIRR